MIDVNKASLIRTFSTQSPEALIRFEGLAMGIIFLKEFSLINSPDYGTARLTFRTHPSSPEFGSGIFPDPGKIP